MAASLGWIARGLSEGVLGAFPSLLFIPPVIPLSLETLELTVPPVRVRGVTSAQTVRGACGGERCGACRKSLQAQQFPPRSLHGAATFPAPLPAPLPALRGTCSQMSGSGKPGSRAALRAGEAVALARCRPSLRVRCALHQVYPRPGRLLDANQEPQNCFCREHQRGVS